MTVPHYDIDVEPEQVKTVVELINGIEEQFGKKPMKVILPTLAYLVGRFLSGTPRNLRAAAATELLDKAKKVMVACDKTKMPQHEMPPKDPPRMPLTKCTNCGKKIDGALSVGGDYTPEPGNYTLCLDCGHLMVFADDMTLRDPTDEEIVEAAGMKEIIMGQKARAAAANARKKHDKG